MENKKQSGEFFSPEMTYMKYQRAWNGRVENIESEGCPMIRPWRFRFQTTGIAGMAPKMGFPMVEQIRFIFVSGILFNDVICFLWQAIHSHEYGI